MFLNSVSKLLLIIFMICSYLYNEPKKRIAPFCFPSPPLPHPPHPHSSPPISTSSPTLFPPSSASPTHHIYFTCLHELTAAHVTSHLFCILNALHLGNNWTWMCCVAHTLTAAVGRAIMDPVAVCIRRVNRTRLTSQQQMQLIRFRFIEFDMTMTRYYTF